MQLLVNIYFVSIIKYKFGNKILLCHPLNGPGQSVVHCFYQFWQTLSLRRRWSGRLSSAVVWVNATAVDAVKMVDRIPSYAETVRVFHAVTNRRTTTMANNKTLTQMIKLISCDISYDISFSIISHGDILFCRHITNLILITCERQIHQTT